MDGQRTGCNRSVIAFFERKTYNINRIFSDPPVEMELMEMEEKESGKRLPPAPHKGRKAAVIAAVGIVGVLAASYLVLCAVAARDRFWPYTEVMGTDVSGMSIAQAEETLTGLVPQQCEGRTVTLYEQGSGIRYTIEAKGLMEPAGLVGDFSCGNGKGSFFTAGGRYLRNLVEKTGSEVQLSLRYTDEGKARMDAALEELSKRLDIDDNETTYEVTDTAILFQKGRDGMTVDRNAVQEGVAAAVLGDGPEEVAVSLIQSAPEEPDFEAIRNEVRTEVADAYLDRESREIVPSVVGRDFDVEAARTALAETADGGLCRVELILTQPEVTTQELTHNLFRDTLGEAATKFTGTSARKMNIKLACSFIDEQLVFPGEEFSFNALCSPYTASNGYGKAGAYVNGKTEDTVAGGICQASSTLYWATLKANLKTVERWAHSYEPSYVNGGLDATVYGDYGASGSLDFRFRNNTDYPIKIKAYVDDSNYVRVSIYGTDTTGIHGEPYSTNRVVTQYAQTVYEPNGSIPQGTTQKDPERTAYNAVSIETYQKLVDAQGNVISTQRLYQTKYRLRNAVVFYNPADAALWGIDPSTGLKTLEPVVGPQGPNGEEPPAETPNSSESPAPQESNPTGQPLESPAPEETSEPSPEPTPEPDPNAPLLPPGL